MSRGGPTNESGARRTGGQGVRAPKAGSVGARDFTRKRRSLQRQVARKQQVRERAKKRSSSQREVRAWLRRVPRAAWICAAVAVLNAACWSIVMPPFQVPDEPDHVAYVKQIVHGRLPSSSEDSYASDQETFVALNDLNYYDVRQAPRHHTISSRAQQTKLESDLAGAETRRFRVGDAAGVAATQPPLYYVLEALPYSLASNIVSRLQLMRLLSALMAGVTALFTFLFVRETLPKVAWAWAIGGLAAALTPLLAQMSGAVNPDAMLFAVAAGVFYCLARAFRRGFTRKTAIAAGALVAVGLMTKLNFVGLLPGVLLGLVVLSVRAARVRGRSAYVSLAIACGIGLAPAALYAFVNAFSSHPLLGLTSGVINGAHPSLSELSYIWQLFLPRIAGMHSYFPGLSTTFQFWFRGYVGLFGWIDTTFPGWVYKFALGPAVAILALCLRELIAQRAALRPRIAELIVLAAMAAGLMGMIGVISWGGFPGKTAEFAEARYLLPLLPLFAVVIALAARGAGRRWGPTVGVAIVMLFLAHDLFSQLLVAGRFYA
jgi:Predicted membrane protein (DUF2142)